MWIVRCSPSTGKEEVIIAIHFGVTVLCIVEKLCVDLDAYLLQIGNDVTLYTRHFGIVILYDEVDFKVLACHGD